MQGGLGALPADQPPLPCVPLGPRAGAARPDPAATSGSPSPYGALDSSGFRVRKQSPADGSLLEGRGLRVSKRSPEEKCAPRRV